MLPRPWTLVGFLWFSYLLNHADRQIVPVLFPALRQAFGFSDAMLGLTHAVFLWTYGLCSPLAGVLGDRFSKPKLAAGSLAAWSGVTMLAGASPFGGFLIGCRLLLGATECLFYPSAAALIGNAHPPATRSRAMGLMVSSQIFGVALGGTLASALGERFGWRVPFFVLGALGVAYALPLWLYLRTWPGAASPSAGLAGLGQLLRIAPFRHVIGFIAVSNFSLFLVYSWLPSMVADRLHLGLARAGFEASVFPQLGTLLGLLLGGWGADLAGRRWARGRFGVVAAGFLLSAAAMLWLGQATTLDSLRAAAIAFGFANGLVSGNQVPCAFDVVPEHLRASTVGAFNFLGGIVSGLAPLAGGLSRGTIGLEQLMLWTALLLAAGSLFPLLALRREPAR